ncbi:MAG: (d)CMP kinase [Opitutales bacterium]
MTADPAPDLPAGLPIITVDGGAATGKSSTSRGVANALGFLHVDTGAHYRGVTLALTRLGIDTTDTAAVQAALADLPLGTEVVDGSARLAIAGEVPGPAELRAPAVNATVSTVAAIPAVRQFLFEYQRGQAQVARDHGFAGLIMEGRDIGSVIFPDAPFRFFLEADPETRAARRIRDGETDAVDKRDTQDRTRKVAPLTCPDGATVINTGEYDLEGVIAIIVDHYRRATAGR